MFIENDPKTWDQPWEYEYLYSRTTKVMKVWPAKAENQAPPIDSYHALDEKDAMKWLKCKYPSSRDLED